MKTLSRSFLIFILFAFVPLSYGESCEPNLSNDVKSEIDNFVHLGESLTGAELANKLWQIGELSNEYAAYMQGQLSPEQMKRIYLYNIDRELSQNLELNDIQQEFLQQAKLTTARVFDETWHYQHPELLKFVADGEILLGVVTFSRVFGDVYPRHILQIER
ncbi:hypothetical protein [Aliidiomarina quisquiliarum]|uniref:hypothetical protein n=1 Tax=Aliidiomarina quisquiliarum TaxID=2938947 RepID=UPI00208E5043|nr:hypothetical protein [Aliidiomarina quisquiliarum]MCO4319924.1 hypothetical protein [Aliidiomarina quisquiliarum]